MKGIMRRQQIRFVARICAAHLTDSIVQTSGEFGEDERILPMVRELLFACLHRAATDWSGLATRALFNSEYPFAVVRANRIFSTSTQGSQISADICITLCY
jgi:hypothetical protein